MAPHEDAPTATVRLVGVPLRTRAAFGDYTGGLLRELALIEIGAGRSASTTLPQRLLDLAAEIRTTYAPFQAEAAATALAAEAAGLETCDLGYTVPPGLGPFVEHLADVMDEADDYCRDAQHVLTMPPAPEVHAYRTWVFTEFVRQLAGHAPRPWADVAGGPAGGPVLTGRAAPAPDPSPVSRCGPDTCEVIGEPLALPPVPTSVGAARRHVRAVLRAAGAGDVDEAAELGTSELLTNAVLHAATPVLLTVCRSGAGTVRIAVTDSSPQALQPRRSGATSTTGRGLDLLDTISRDWGVDAPAAHGEPGKTVWFEPAASGGEDAPS
ncbi:hypothetical protein GTR02_09730 [Kineococcus sp. R8]|uniref:ATP-binding protein n=1 Tax=Kineococcus siccus TaxID=2696567 RepID=UPI001411EE2A|nr:ATP-binding protein [Kineococcus siccus]NAZ82096.1 hypothetical protein [Kineococcus siccus]